MAQSPPPMTDAEALAMLDWYRAAGVDVAVGDEPVDRFATSAVAPATTTVHIKNPLCCCPEVFIRTFPKSDSALLH